MNIEKSEITLMIAEVIPKEVLSKQCLGMVGFHDVFRGVHFLASASSHLLKVGHQRGRGAIAYYDENQGTDSVVEYIGPDKTVHSVVERGSPMCHKYSDVLQKDRSFDHDYEWTIDS